MSDTVLQLPVGVTEIKIDGVNYVGDGSNQITVPTAAVTAAIKGSWRQNMPGIVIAVAVPPTNPAS